MLMELDKYFLLNPVPTAPLDIYLGGKVSNFVFPNGFEAYAFSSSQYVKEAINNVADHLEKQGMRLCIRDSTPISPIYRPELDATTELIPAGSS